MVKTPNFKLIAKGKDITENIRKNLIQISFEDKEGHESDEISFMVSGIYAKPYFGDNLVLYLGYGENLWKCGSFSVQTCQRDYKAITTEVRATAVNFASPIKHKKTRTWQDSDMFSIAKKIADENSLKCSFGGSNIGVVSVLQDNVNDLDFLYNLAFKHDYLMAVKNDTLIITAKDGKVGGITPKNETLPKTKIALNECFSLSISEANRYAYDSVIVSWHEIASGETKSIKVGKGSSQFCMKIAEPKSDNEAFKKGEAKLNELRRGSIIGRCEIAGANIKAGSKLVLKGVDGYENTEFSIKSVSFRLDVNSFTSLVEFEG